MLDRRGRRGSPGASPSPPRRCCSSRGARRPDARRLVRDDRARRPRRGARRGPRAEVVGCAVLERAVALAPIGGRRRRSERLLSSPSRSCSRATRCPALAELMHLRRAGRHVVRALRASPRSCCAARSTPRARRARVGRLVYPLASLSYLEWRRGRWNAGAGRRGGGRASRARHRAGRAALATRCARWRGCEAGRGDARAAAEHNAEALRSSSRWASRSPFAIYVHASIGFASLTEERTDAARRGAPARGSRSSTSSAARSPPCILFEARPHRGAARAGRAATTPTRAAERSRARRRVDGARRGPTR